LSALANRGAGQPYLMAIKLQGEPTTLHLRAYLRDPIAAYAWADIKLVPPPVQELAAKTSQRSALAWKIFSRGGSASGPTEYELLFDPAKNHDAWVLPGSSSASPASSLGVLGEAPEAPYSITAESDAAAEAIESDPNEVAEFRKKIAEGNYSVPDVRATAKTRGSAQKAFADEVKSNYGYRCAITRIAIKDFLIASHIVPWSMDQNIRLDPSNGICLSLLMDRAFEKGYLFIEDDFVIRINARKLGKDSVLQGLLAPYHGKKLVLPSKGVPQAEYLRRRRSLAANV
jgi:hypothetical protein